MFNFTNSHISNVDIYIGHININTVKCPDLINFRNNLPYSPKSNLDLELQDILSKNNKSNFINLSPHDISVITDIYYILKIPKNFLNRLELYISNIKYPYTYLDIKIIKIYKKICTKYKLQEKFDIYSSILTNSQQNCPCVIAIKNVLNYKYSDFNTYELTKSLDFVSYKDKFIIFNILLLKNPDLQIFNVNCIYEKNFIIFLAFFLKNNDKGLKFLKYKQLDLLNQNMFLDYILTLNNEENRKYINLSKIFKNFSNDFIDINSLLVLLNVTRSVFMLRSEIIKFPIIEILLNLLEEDNIKFLKEENSNIDYKIIYKGITRSYKKIILNIFTNLLLEFGNYRKIFVELKGFEKVERCREYPYEILRLYKNYLYDNTVESKMNFLEYGDEWFENIFNHNETNITENYTNGFISDIEESTNNSIDNNALNLSSNNSLLSNTTSNNNISNNIDINIDNTTSNNVTTSNNNNNIDNNTLVCNGANSYYDNQMMEVLFNLIRNLVCDKIHISNYLIKKIFIHLINTTNKKILIHILYCMVNISANDIKFRDLLLQDNDVLLRLKDLFNIHDFNLSLVWILINLSWKDDGYEERIRIINKYDFQEILMKIESTNGFLVDKIQTALENLKEPN
ncbi:armadillo repeat-containing protein [Vairimorpha necatrix]|uniref:Armadillo repeat-containing protein n=1 Tax=Vairimorpha necatrix TaxID=6039 RepID=A0AAX4JF84_9MICR